MRLTTLGVLSLLLCGLANAAEPISASDLDFFEKQVRPLLVERCYKCHSAQSEKVKGHLLLDTREGCLKGGDSGPAVVPGKPDKSLLIEAIRYTNADMEMPPKSKLAQAEIDVLTKWVAMGAPDPRTGTAAVATKKSGMTIEEGRQFWAYKPVKPTEPPAVKDANWAKGDIDRFVLAKLEEKGLKPAADADAATLVRRVYFDLIGLQPTPAEIDAFIADTSADRYEKLVDRLLASPRFGERWGRHWLDVARFGESLTLRGFVLKDAWRYRDYVIESFNADRPFDRFMQEQVAGDLMKADSMEERRRQMVGTAFLAIGNTNLEEQDKKQLEMDVVDEQLDTLGKAFLAQTLGCARCHDHKFDPISTKDYYALAGILHSTTTLEHANVSKWLEVPLPMEADKAREIEKQEAAVAALAAKIKQAKAAVAKAGKGEAPNIAVADLPGIVIDDAQAKRVGAWRESQSVKPYIGDGYTTDDGDKSEEKTLTFMPEIVESGRYEVRFAYTASKNRASNASLTVFSADGEKTIVLNQREQPPIDGHFVSLGTYAFEKGGQGFVIVSNMNADGHVVADAVQFLPASEGDSAAPVVADAKGKSKEKHASAEEVKQLEAELKKMQEAGPKRETTISVREAKAVGNTRVHIRGSVHTLGDEVPRGFLRVISVKQTPAVPVDQSGRRELGQWLADPQNPLPARVMANRCWHWLFGAGIVRTTDNFGTTGELPSHPELLDYLADRFVKDGWSVKSLVRQIVLSHTYRLASSVDSKAAATDPENRLLSHTNRRRMDCDAIRDTVLSVSGELDLSFTGGLSYKAGLASDFGYKDSERRRSVYVPTFRNALPELFEVFDAADPSVCTGRRNVSTVAPQALYLLNHPFVLEQAKHAAERLMKEDGDERTKVLRAYRIALGRPPTAAESEMAWQFIETAQDRTKAFAELFHALFASVDFRYVD